MTHSRNMMRRGHGGVVLGVEERSLLSRGYLIEADMGSGTFSKVKKVRQQRTGETLAVKIVDRSKAKPEYLRHFFRRELDIIQKVQHSSIIRTIEVFDCHSRTFIVMELASKGDLEQFISLVGAFKEQSPLDLCHMIVRQLFEAILHVHNLGIAHRDIKCENVMLDRYTNAKLGDFGFAKQTNTGELSQTFCGSLAYSPPELVQGNPYNVFPVDMWGLGIVAYIMLVGLMPFDDRDVPKLLADQLTGDINYFSLTTPSFLARKLIRQLLEPHPSRRLTAKDALTAAWIRDTPYFNLPTIPHGNSQQLI